MANLRTLNIVITDHNAPGVCTQGYLVQKKATGDPGFTLVNTQYDSPIVITGLAENTQYEISIQRICCDGSSQAAQIIEYNTLPLSDEIEGLAFTPASESIVINWDDFTGADGYVVYQSETNDINTATLIYNGATSGHTAIDLEPSTTYYFWIAAYDGDQFSAFEAGNSTTTS